MDLIPQRLGANQLGTSLGPAQTHPLGQAFTGQTDLLPLYMLRFDRENTRRAYHLDLATFFGSEVVTLEMASGVSFTAVNQFIASQEADGCAVSTIRRRVAALRGFFSWLVALGQLGLNPADRQLIRRVARESASERVFTVLTAPEASQLLAAVDLDTAQGLRDRTLLLVLLHCVLRRSEAAVLDVENLITSGRYHLFHLARAKGGANQSVKIPDHVRDDVNHMIEFYGYRSGPLWRSFSKNGSAGRRLSGSSIYSIVNKHAIRAGLSHKVGAHTLRHTGCTLAIEGGATIQQVQTHARHKSIETTMLYVHQRDRLANSAADRIQIGPLPPSPEASE